MKAKATKLIDAAIDSMHELSEECATEPNEWLVIIEAEKAIHEVRKVFEQELDTRKEGP